MLAPGPCPISALDGYKRRRSHPPPRRLGVVTLCSGIEAPIQCLENLNIRFRHLAACDNDASVKRVLLRNFSPERFISDVALATESLAGLPQDAIDLLVAGFPCQSFSLQGTRKGCRDGQRGLLILHIIRVLMQCMPKVCILENVAGLTMGAMRETFEAILELLRSVSKGPLGYHVEWQILDTKFYSVPQSRPRLYVVMFRSDVYDPSSSALYGPHLHTRELEGPRGGPKPAWDFTFHVE